MTTDVSSAQAVHENWYSTSGKIIASVTAGLVFGAQFGLAPSEGKLITVCNEQSCEAEPSIYSSKNEQPILRVERGRTHGRDIVVGIINVGSSSTGDFLADQSSTS